MNSSTYPTLDPELEQYLEPMEGFGKMLRHPLVYSVPYFGEADNERLNQQLAFRKRTLREAIESGDHEKYVFTHERAYRLDALLELQGDITQRKLNSLILDVYVDSENARENYDEWLNLLEPLTGEDPWNSVKDLPAGKFTMYRGGPVMGFSWTLDLDRAQWFAKRWGAQGEVWEATVDKNSVIGYYDGRGEKEVVAVYDHIRHAITKLNE
jgi:hypothetical protein